MTQTVSDERYSITIEWSDEDQIFIASFPEWGTLVHTHGSTSDEALANGRELLAALIESRQCLGEALPEPWITSQV